MVGTARVTDFLPRVARNAPRFRPREQDCWRVVGPSARLHNQYSKSHPLSDGTFLPVPPVKTTMTLRASYPRQSDFRSYSRKFLSLLSVGTRALATPPIKVNVSYGGDQVSSAVFPDTQAINFFKRTRAVGVERLTHSVHRG